MSDQTQPKLSLEEELDVLEAVYKVGKEKGLDLLRPEQVKKLRDAGRMGVQEHRGVRERARRTSKQEALEAARAVVSQMMFGVDGVCKKHYGDQVWEDMQKDKKQAVRDGLFEEFYGGSPADIGFAIFKTFVGDYNANS